MSIMMLGGNRTLIIERVLFNGRIHTLDSRQPQASALAIAQGRIVAVGSDEDLLHLARAETRRENLAGKAVIPGLTDAHIHWEMTARALNDVNLFEVPSKAMAVERVAAHAASTPAGEWITGYGWMQEIWQDRAFPSAADLDAAVPAHPVYLRAKSGHAAWVNRAALDFCGITASTSDPEGGKIARDANGNPSGILFENAMALVGDRVPRWDVHRLARMMQTAQQHALASGLTGIHDFDNPTCMAALQVLREQGQLALRVVKNINKDWLDAAIALGIRWGFGDEWIRFGGLKLFSDGALGPRTALMIDPYEGEPENIGIAVLEKEEMIELVGRASTAGLPSTIHAIGDRAVHNVLDVYEVVRAQEAARGEAPETRRHRIEHVQLIHQDDAPRLAQMQIIASMQPIHATSDYLVADRYWGARSRWGYNARLQLDHGAVVAFGSDSPIEPFEPLKGIHAAVTRRRADGSPGPDGWYPEYRLTVAEALRGFTQGAAYAAGLEQQLGTLASGYLADLVVLEQDLFSIDPAAIPDVKILATMVGGEWRYGGVA